MRGPNDNHSGLFVYFSPEERVPKQHPIRRIKRMADEALRKLSPVFDAMYAQNGRPSVPPERLLKAQLLMALYTVRSDRLFCEMLDYNILFRWFLDMDLESASFDPSTFSKNRERLVRQNVAVKFLDAVVAQARSGGLLSDEHFSVDGTLVAAWASHKSFQPKDGSGNGPDAGGDRDFHGEKRKNDTHESRTDPEAKLYRKSNNTAAQLCYAVHALMDNRHGLLTDVMASPSVGVREPEAALKLIDRQRRKNVKPKTVGADKGYHEKAFVKALRKKKIKPHVACKVNLHTPGLDGRTTGSAGYRASQIVRKRIEQCFGWMKTVGGLRKTPFKGVARTDFFARMNAAAYNLRRMCVLLPGDVRPQGA